MYARQSEMETQEENSQNQVTIMLALLASEPAQTPADDSSLYRMDFTMSCAIRFNHVSEAKYLERFAHLYLLRDTDACNHLTRMLDNLCFVGVFWASNQPG
jgi:hypothetical protein